MDLAVSYTFFHLCFYVHFIPFICLALVKSHPFLWFSPYIIQSPKEETTDGMEWGRGYHLVLWFYFQVCALKIVTVIFFKTTILSHMRNHTNGMTYLELFGSVHGLEQIQQSIWSHTERFTLRVKHWHTETVALNSWPPHQPCDKLLLEIPAVSRVIIHVMWVGYCLRKAKQAPFTIMFLWICAVNLSCFCLRYNISLQGF